jgi:hypothetical protein
VWFTSLWGLNGVVIGTTAGFALVFPLFLYWVTRTFDVSVRDFAREVWLPAYSLAAVLAGALLALNSVADLSEPALLVATGIVATLGYWAAFYALWLRPEERAFFRQLMRRR